MSVASPTKRANRPLVAVLPPVEMWKTEYRYATLKRNGRYPVRTVGYVVRICVHRGTFVDERISDPIINHCWGIGLNEPCEHEKCRKAMREYNANSN